MGEATSWRPPGGRNGGAWDQQEPLSEKNDHQPLELLSPLTADGACSVAFAQPCKQKHPRPAETSTPLFSSLMGKLRTQCCEWQASFMCSGERVWRSCLSYRGDVGHTHTKLWKQYGRYHHIWPGEELPSVQGTSRAPQGVDSYPKTRVAVRARSAQLWVKNCPGRTCSRCKGPVQE